MSFCVRDFIFGMAVGMVVLRIILVWWMGWKF